MGGKLVTSGNVGSGVEGGGGGGTLLHTVS